ncbi:MAG: phosphatidate cytidylyltransferase [Gammaproteobacteria bacterium]|nr:phosphatidate cytidylyltransferase [Gammaproteobacteria bacterium]NIR84157.1 phosphatidate cytidylyltransferase [Gammaproteobacteria bacterium]NIR89469.1 phosphatidate cytidylyltransferase [Gammaproteobacteria bacterium]NIU05312.1 phosphatidate cytidylyltransferase [Gammaproteobacteria bacterium]NIV52252.1 phosphatidate cytidylyltransferase [Gammaproteobacteria bacterium]
MLTAAILIPLVVAAVLVLDTGYVGLLLAAIVLGGAWEWSALVSLRAPWARWLYTLTLLPLLYTAHRVLDVPGGLLGILGAGLAWWLVALVLVLRLQRSGVGPRLPAWIGIVIGWLLLVPPWVGLAYLHGQLEHGPTWVIFVLALTWLADSGAYLAGRRWGRRRMAARVSPAKTWEGVAGGLLAAGVLALAGGMAVATGVGHLLLFVLLCLATVGASVLGDLAESLFKRQAGVKDSGRLLPGHGGVLDRIDSLTAAAPVFAFGMYWWGT